jgi:hypothetical protein
MMLTFSPRPTASDEKSAVSADSGAIAVVYPSRTEREMMSSLIPVIELAILF